jgi:hypothetical protein
MTQWMRTVQATIELLSEMVDREWRTLEEWQTNSAVPRPLFAQIGQWLEVFAGQPLFQPWGTYREQQRLLAQQMREELFVLLTELDPAHAMAVLCSLPAAQVMGYAQDRLALLLKVDGADMQAWEQQGFTRLREVVSSRTPLVFFVAQRVAEMESGRVEPFAEGRGALAFTRDVGHAVERGNASREAAVDARELVMGETREGATAGAIFAWQDVRDIREEGLAHLLQAARENVHFDLRSYVTPALELSIRQAFHQHGVDESEQVQSLFANEDAIAVQLVGERMKVEMSGGREERADG